MDNIHNAPVLDFMKHSLVFLVKDLPPSFSLLASLKVDGIIFLWIRLADLVVRGQPIFK